MNQFTSFKMNYYETVLYILISVSNPDLPFLNAVLKSKFENGEDPFPSSKTVFCLQEI